MDWLVNKYTLLAVGGAAGTLLRYLVQGWGQELTRGTFPLGTLLVNVAGCLAIGLLNTVFAGPVPIRPEYRIGLTIGLLGGFTTFSAFGWETMALTGDGQFLRASLNVLLSVGLGLAAVWCGHQIGQRCFGV